VRQRQIRGQSAPRRTTVSPAYAILDGTVTRSDRLGGTADRRYYAGKHRHHGVNIQIIADCAGRLIWLSPALPGCTHDLTAAREHGIIDALAEAMVNDVCGQGLSGCWRQRAYAIQAAPPAAAVAPQPKDRQPCHAKIRGIGERAIATLKHWKLLTKLRCCPKRATAVPAAILVLEHVDEQRTSR
jgi:hypothetical protein